MSSETATGRQVHLHVFPEHRAQPRELPQWMRASRKSIEPAHFGQRLEDARDPQPIPSQAPGGNVRADPLGAARAALEDARRNVEQEQQALDVLRGELESERTTLAEAASEISAAQKRVLEANIAQLAEIALAVVQAIITDAFSEAPERASALARAALEPDQAAALRVGPALHIALLESGEATSAVLDASLAPYGCVAESPSKRVVAGLEDRLAEVLHALKEAT